MKRRYTGEFPRSSEHDIKKELSKAQLAGIGAVAMAFNYVEYQIDRILGQAINIDPPLLKEIATRINGIDGKIAIITQFARSLYFPVETCQLIEDSLGENGCKKMKRYRDGIVHARILDSDLGLGIVTERQGRRSEVLLTVQALDLLFDHLHAFRLELTPLVMAFHYAQVVTDLHDNPRRKSQYEETTQYWLSQYLEGRKLRLNLQPLPEFPEEPQWIEILVK